MFDFKSCNLEELLANKTMYYDKIDFSIIEESWKILQSLIKVPYVIHLVGTNGKGSTGRFLAHYLNKIGKKVLHYSSPHIKKFNERIWLDGEDISDKDLEDTHKKIQNILPLILLSKLTYFEYTTLLALYKADNMDYLVLEAGLGGEFDGTNVIKNDLSLITTIDLDHVQFLGNSIKEISYTKMRACDKNMILGHQVHEEVFLHAKDLVKERDYKLFTIKDFDLSTFKIDLNLAPYLLKNLDLCLSALQFLGLSINIEVFKSLELKGRFEALNDNITLDVGHNPLAASEIKKLYKNKKIILVYNSYADKDYEKVLKILKPIIKEVKILSINDERMLKKEILIKLCENLNIMVSDFKNINNNEKYLVFGSFLVVEKFMGIYER